MQQNFQQLRPKLHTVMEKRQAFENATPGDPGYQASVDALAHAEADFAQARTLREGALRSRIHDLLTTAQRSKLKQLIAERKARFQKERQAARAQPATGAPTPPASH